jgi:hypothetical protein
MDHRRNPPVEPTGKVLRLVPRRRGRPTTTLDVELVKEEREQRRRDQRAAAWFDAAWVALAWTVSVWELRRAIAHREVFGVETTIAFLVAIALPLVRARRIIAALRRGTAVLKEVRAIRRAKREGAAAVEEEQPKPHASGPLQ